MQISKILADETISNLSKIIKVQTIIHSNFSEVDINTLDHIELDKHLFERVNLAMEELFEGNLELKHRKPHRVTYNSEYVDANTAVSDIEAFKKELIDCSQIIFSILGALGMTEDEFMAKWEQKVNKIKHLTASSKYETKSLFEEDNISH